MVSLESLNEAVLALCPSTMSLDGGNDDMSDAELDARIAAPLLQHNFRVK